MRTESIDDAAAREEAKCEFFLRLVDEVGLTDDAARRLTERHFRRLEGEHENRDTMEPTGPKTPPRTPRNAGGRTQHEDAPGAIGSQEPTRTAAEEAEKGQEMTKSPVVSKSLVRRIGAQVDAPDDIRQRSMEMISSDPDAALLVLKCWRDLGRIEESAQAELEDCDTLEDLQAWRRKWITGGRK